MLDEEFNSFMVTVNDKLTEIRKAVFDAVKKEKYFFDQQVLNHEEYRKFCDLTPSVFNTKTKDRDLKSLEKLVNEVVPGI